MANLEYPGNAVDIETMQARARRSAHVQRAQAMLGAACLATVGIVAVAGAFLTRIF